MTTADNRFELLSCSSVTVPKSYDHVTQLATFALYAKKENFYYCEEAITDKNFAGATAKLIPGKTYMVKIFGIKQGKVVTSDDCLALLATQRATLVGAQGLSLVRQLKKNELPVGKWTVSFNDKDALWEDPFGYHRVPLMLRCSDGGWHFSLGSFGRGWDGGVCLLCLCD